MECRGYNGNHNSSQRTLRHRERSLPKPIGSISGVRSYHPLPGYDTRLPSLGPSRQVLEASYIISPKPIEPSA
jgi:hypothetical protein